MAFYKISPTLAKEMRAGQFLKPPEPDTPGYKIVESSDPDFPQRTWREVFVIRDVAVKVDGDKEVVQFTLTVPNDVVSTNQGRTANASFFFPWKAAERGEKGAQMGCSINYREVLALLTAVGYDGEFASLDQLPIAQLRNMRVSAQVRQAPDKDGTPRQNIGYFRAPK